MLQLTDAETELLENDTVVFMHVNRVLEWVSIMQKIYDFSRKNIYHRIDILSIKINFKPNYYRTYRNKNAVWGLSFNNIKFVLYLSVRGVVIQFPQNTKYSSQIYVIKKLNKLI